ncbi:MAG: carboxypeptidase-like regulatory domain-containing protein [Candidatus Sulfopaludibacter sp.]|nr:carboxypeptidase-like regulatory domain-containing protein [Candidatus Sulfopaludibacter sp.]
METPAVILLMAAAALHAQTGVAVEGKVVSTVGNAAVKRAVVTLRGEEIYLCRSDAHGQFSLKDVVPGRYEVEASHEGFQSKPEPAVTIGPGPATLELHLVPQALIAGRIVDELGDPVPDADVEAMHYRYQAGKKQLQSTARVKTNDRGEYLIADLAPSRYYVRASDPEHDPPIIGNYNDRGPRRQQVYAPAFYPGTRGANRASMLSVARGDELQRLDVQIHRESVYSIRGRMAPDISVGLIRRFDEPAFAYATRPSENGLFEIWGLTPGAYAVTGTRQKALYAMRKVEILNDDVEGVDLTSPTAIAVNGNVQAGGVNGLRVVLKSEEAAALDINTPVQADGSFTVNAQPDTYVVHLQGDGVWLKSMRIGDREVADHRLVPGRLPGPVTLVASTETGEIHGSVADTNGQPLAGVNVTLLPDQSLPYWPDLAQVATTNGDGAFTFSRVVPGNYRLFALADSEAGAPLDGEFRKPFDDKGTPVQVQTGSTATVRLAVIQMK